MSITEWLNKHLVDGWNRPFRFHSIKSVTVGMVLSSASTGLALVYGSADPLQHAMIPHWMTSAIFFVIFTGSFIGRLWKQKGKKDGDA